MRGQKDTVMAIRIQILSVLVALMPWAGLVACATTVGSARWARVSATGGPKIVATAQRLVGRSYGRTWKGTRLDCSGLVQAVYAQHGYTLPRTSRDQSRLGRRVDWDDLAPGDLLFFSRHPGGRLVNHVGIATGNGTMIHVSSRRGVVVDPIAWEHYEDRRVIARRILGHIRP